MVIVESFLLFHLNKQLFYSAEYSKIAKIPSIGVSVTEQKVLDALSLGVSIPLPASDTAPMVLNKEHLLVASSMSLKRYLDERQSKPKKLDIKQRDISEEEITQYTELEFGFELNGNFSLSFGCL